MMDGIWRRQGLQEIYGEGSNDDKILVPIDNEEDYSLYYYEDGNLERNTGEGQRDGATVFTLPPFDP